MTLERIQSKRILHTLVFLCVYNVTIVTYGDRCGCHTPGNTGEETAQEEHPEAHSPPEQHVSNTRLQM